jgi:hypothetical protein
MRVSTLLFTAGCNDFVNYQIPRLLTTSYSTLFEIGIIGLLTAVCAMMREIPLSG